jgi:hypothetical protein
MAKAKTQPNKDTDIKTDVDYIVTHPDNKHYLKIDAYYGTTHETSFINIQGELVVMNNQDITGFLGYGKDLVSKSIRIRTRAFADIDDRGVDRVRLDYLIDQSEAALVNKYDKPEADNDKPYLRFTINFKAQ